MKKSCIGSLVFAGLSAAHSATWTVTFDGTEYPARDTRVDNKIGAKRIEWNFKDAFNFPWHAVTDVENPGIACGMSPSPPELAAKARAGSTVKVRWTNIIRMHNGPVMSYLGAINSPTQTPMETEFFKISEAGYNKTTRKWANEVLIENDTTDTFKLPSDIKPGLYVLRTELLALHGNRNGGSIPTQNSGPQFYTHCFNVEITGNGTKVPKGVTFPGGYKRNDPGVMFNLYAGGQAAKDNYIIPGPPVYAGAYDEPIGSPPVVSALERGAFPSAEFEAKYQALRDRYNSYADKSADLVNSAQPGTRMKSGLDVPKLVEYTFTRTTENESIQKEIGKLREEAIKLGYVKTV